MAEMSQEMLQETQARLRSRVDDFVDKIHPVFEEMGWTYWDANGVPSKDDLRCNCLRLISLLQVGETSYYVASGRITVEYQMSKPDHAEAKLRLGYPREKVNVYSAELE